VTVVLPLIVTLQVSVLALVHPVHEAKGFPLAVVGAVRVTAAPESYVRVKPVVPFPAPVTSLGETVIATPLEGLVEFTVSTSVTGGGGVPPPPPPQQADSNTLRPIPIQTAAFHPKAFMSASTPAQISAFRRAVFPGGSSVKRVSELASFYIHYPGGVNPCPLHPEGE
jgi:hypothetical protein